jgi:SAM-dependent methyltransferase
MVGNTSRGDGATRCVGGAGRLGFWLSRFASERTRLARLGQAFDELCIDLRGKRVWGTAQALNDTNVTAAPRASFDVIVSSLESDVLPDAPSFFTTLKERLEPGGVLCVFVRTPEQGVSGLVREDVVWTVAGSIAHAGFDVLFAEGSEHVRDVGINPNGLGTLLRLVAHGLRTALDFFTPRRFRENVARLLHRMDLCPRQALVVARRGFA